MNDEPIAYTKDGRPLFDNVPTVVAMLVTTHDNHLIVIRRANEPGRGKIALPGGHHMAGMTWQQCGVEEVRQETGYEILPDLITQFSETVTDEYGKNLIIGRYLAAAMIRRADATHDEEVTEVMRLDLAGDFPQPNEWAFDLHFMAARKFQQKLRE